MSRHLPMKRLWEAVLFENIKCAVGGPNTASQHAEDYDFVKADARRWIGSPDFEIVCTLAGFDPAMVCDRVKAGRVTAADFAQRHRALADGTSLSLRADARRAAA
ncbi:hypothetical protein [Falsirhodobacter sp. 1013]|uniref:hypothetical protein n=1 Tax=Falsirhodobacter sp. 1013 TaxID=3417566 RepID=UPI003EB79F4E